MTPARLSPQDWMTDPSTGAVIAALEAEGAEVDVAPALLPRTPAQRSKPAPTLDCPRRDAAGASTAQSEERFNTGIQGCLTGSHRRRNVRRSGTSRHGNEERC